MTSVKLLLVERFTGQISTSAWGEKWRPAKKMSQGLKLQAMRDDILWRSDEVVVFPFPFLIALQVGFVVASIALCFVYSRYLPM